MYTSSCLNFVSIETGFKNAYTVQTRYFQFQLGRRETKRGEMIVVRPTLVLRNDFIQQHRLGIIIELDVVQRQSKSFQCHPFDFLLSAVDLQHVVETNRSARFDATATNAGTMRKGSCEQLSKPIRYYIVIPTVSLFTHRKEASISAVKNVCCCPVARTHYQLDCLLENRVRFLHMIHRHSEQA